MLWCFDKLRTAQLNFNFTDTMPPLDVIIIDVNSMDLSQVEC